jgi:hypothetical protein
MTEGSAEQGATTEQQDKPIDASTSPVGEAFDNAWKSGGNIDLKNIIGSVENQYGKGVDEIINGNKNTQAEISEANRTATDTKDAETPQVSDQPHRIARAVAEETAGITAETAKTVEGIKAGDEEALTKAGDIRDKIGQTRTHAENIDTVVDNNADNSTESRMASETQKQAESLLQEAENKLAEAENENANMSEEEKELAKEAAEKAEQNGTDIETEKENLEKNEDEPKENVWERWWEKAA